MTVRRPYGFLLCALLLASVAPGPGAAPVRRSLADLAADSDLIFIGRCESVSCHWNRSRSLIFTANRFRVIRALKGAPGATVTLEEPGGVVGDRGLQVPGAPRYRVGEEVLLCVRRTLLGRFETFGAGQGRFRVVRDERGRAWVRNDFYRSELAAMNPGGRRKGLAPLAVLAGRLQAAPAAREVR